MGEEESTISCRYCFGDESDGHLISPCKCSGGQKFVHLDCLRRWQRMVLVSQPTHPAYYTDDKRHHICNVCVSRYSCPPPSRAELMASFTGPEIAALIDEGRIIASSRGFSDMLAADRNEIDVRFRRRGSDSYDYWYHGVYLITNVVEDSGMIELDITTMERLDMLRREFNNNQEESIGIDILGRRYQLAPRGGLDGMNDLVSGLASLTVPTKIFLTPNPQTSCGDDHVAAVCISRHLTSPHLLEYAQVQIENALENLNEKFHLPPNALSIEHYAGGPCRPSEISCCIVRGGNGRGWKIVSTLEEGLILAYRNLEIHHNDLYCGDGVYFHGLISRPELNGEIGMVLRYDKKAERWEVRVGSSGQGIKVKPINLIKMERNSNLSIYWGDAQWTRVQLLGEIARGSWGLCDGNINDLLIPIEKRWYKLQENNRLAYAPMTEMTEDYIRNARYEMEQLRFNGYNDRNNNQEIIDSMQ